MFCNKCGNEIKNLEGVKFCNKCGNDISASVSKIATKVEEPQPKIEEVVVKEAPKVDLEKRARNKRNFILTAVIVCLVWMIVVIGGTVLLFTTLFGLLEDVIEDANDNYGYEYNIDDEEEEEIVDEKEDEKVEEKEEDEEPIVTGETKRVGSDEFGYISVPKNWAKFVDVQPNDTLQYSYANVYVATLYAVDTTQITAEQYATNVMNIMNDENTTGVTGAKVKVAGYDALQVYGHYEDVNKWLVAWFFEDGNGKTHYISIEGPDATSEFFNIPDTFSLEE